MKPLYKIGQLIYHRRFNYRGVIFGVDDYFLLSDDWYEKMCKNSKPPKDKPWYNVLVHNTNHTTYVTEQNIVIDNKNKAIIHPMVPILFTTLKNGSYSKSPNWSNGKPIIPNEIGIA